MAWTLWPGYRTEWYVVALYILGRLTAPVMWFFIAEGYHYTRSVKKYAFIQLGIFLTENTKMRCISAGGQWPPLRTAPLPIPTYRGVLCNISKGLSF